MTIAAIVAAVERGPLRGRLVRGGSVPRTSSVRLRPFRGFSFRGRSFVTGHSLD